MAHNTALVVGGKDIHSPMHTDTPYMPPTTHLVLGLDPYTKNPISHSLLIQFLSFQVCGSHKQG